MKMRRQQKILKREGQEEKEEKEACKIKKAMLLIREQLNRDD
jgi:hypothetical protein